MLRFCLKVLGFLALSVIVLVGGALSARAYVQHRNAATFAISSRNGVDEARFVRVGGIDHGVAFAAAVKQAMTPVAP